MKRHTLSTAVREFDDFPDSALVSIAAAGTVATRSRTSIYRHFRAGDLTPIKVGSSTRVRVGDLRRLLGVTPANQGVTA